MTTTIKITELENIGASLASSTLIPVVNMSGTPTTEKAVLGNIANVILAGAGTTYVGVGAATLAGTVTTAAQPNITSVGTLTSLAINGTTTGVSFTANTGVFTGNGNGLSSLVGANVSGAVAFATTANAVAGANVSGAVAFATTANAVAGANVSGAVTYATTANAVAGANVSGFVANATYANLATYATTANAVAGANVSGAVTYATTANAVAGANVSGFVANATYANLATFATTANAVALANVSGAGNISSINIDGSNANVLYGNGVFAPASGGGAAGNAGDIQINVAGNIGADSTLRYVDNGGEMTLYADYLNAPGIFTSDIYAGDGTPSNITLTTSYGNATWTFDTTGNLNTPGDIVGPSGANFTIYSNATAHEFIFADDGTFYAPDDAVLGGNVYIGPGANTVPGIDHEVFLASSNNFPYIQAVVNNVSDNGSAEWVALGARGNDSGGWADMGFTSGGFNDANYTITGPGDGYVFVESYYDGQILGSRGGNLVLATGEQGTSNDIIFGTGGFLTSNIFGRISDANNSLELSRTGATITFPDATEQNTAWTGSVTRIANGTSNVNIPTSNGNVAINVGSNSWVFGTSGNLTVPGSLINDTSIVLSAPAVFNICTIATAGSGYNTGSSLKATTGGSGTGMTVGIGYGLSNQLSSVTVVDPGTGYVNGDVITVSEGTGGTFVITKYNELANQTNNNTVQTDLIFANNTLTLPIYGEIASNANMTLTTNYSNAGNTSSWIFDTDGSLTLPDTTTINANVSITLEANDTGNITGLSVTGDAHANLYAHGNVTIMTDSSNTTPTWTFDTTGNLSLPEGGSIFSEGFTPSGAPGNTISLQPSGSGTTTNQKLLVYPTGGDGDHIHLATGNLYQTELFLGSDNLYVKLANTGNVVVNSNDGVGNSATWTFGTTGNLTLPANTVAINFANGSSAFGNIVATNLDGSSSNVLYGNGIFAAVPVPTVSQDITSNGAMSIMTYDGNLKYVSYATVEPSSGNIAGNNISATGNITGGNISTAGNITGNTNGFTIGYLNIPQIAAANATLALTDAGKHYYSTTAGNFTLTVPTNANVAFATGTAVSIVVQAAGNILVNAASGVTLYMAGNSTSANRVVGGYGMATLMKVASDTWFINGTGVS